jgi:hypothetical protein
MPVAQLAQVAPPSRVRHTPPQRIARIHDDRVDAGVVAAAAHPLLARGVKPQRLVQLPARAAVGRAKQAAGQRAAPHRAVAIVGERPDERRRPFRLLGLGRRLRRILRSRDLGPRRAAVAGAMQLDAEVAVIERREPRAVVGDERERDVVADERRARELVALAARLGDEQSFSRGQQELVHGQPPDSACMT